jgi:ATP-binding cassette, subfamily B, bacterial
VTDDRIGSAGTGRRRYALRYTVGLTLRADRWAAAVALVLILSQAAVAAALALSQRWVVDLALAGRGAGALAACAFGAAALAFSLGGGRVLTNTLLYLTTRVSIAVAQDVLVDSSRIPTIGHLERPVYLDRIERLRRGGTALAWLPWTVLGTVAASISLVATVVLLGSVDPWLAGLAVLAVPPLVAGRRAHRLIEDARDAATELSRREQRFHELCTQAGPAKELYVSGSGAEVDRRADELWSAVTRRELVARLAATGWHAAGWLVFVAGVVGALLVTARLIADGRATYGDAALVLALATQLQGQIRQAVGYVGHLAEGGRLIDHLWWLRAYARSACRGGQRPPDTLTEGVVLDGVGFRYPGAETDTLHDVNVRLRPGTTVALVGENGAGKSTLVKLLTGVYEPTRGAVLVDGQPLRDLDLTAWQRRLSGVPQDFAQLYLRLGDGIGIGEPGRLHDTGAVLDAARRGGVDLVDTLPRGLRSPLGRIFGGAEPSPGQWQRLALARGLMRAEPLLLLLDEPTAALDPEAENELFGTFVAQTRAATARGAITLLVSHRMSMVRMADLIVVLAGGTVAETGSHAELMAAGGRYAQMFRLQERAYAESTGPGDGAVPVLIAGAGPPGPGGEAGPE